MIIVREEHGSTHQREGSDPDVIYWDRLPLVAEGRIRLGELLADGEGDREDLVGWADDLMIETEQVAPPATRRQQMNASQQFRDVNDGSEHPVTRSQSVEASADSRMTLLDVGQVIGVQQIVGHSAFLFHTLEILCRGS